MRIIRPADSGRMGWRAPLLWQSGDGEGAFEFKPAAHLPFVCFFVHAAAAQAAPRVTLDTGSGFDEASTISFRALPFGFYHISLAGRRAVGQMRVSAGKGQTAVRCLIFQTAHPVPVALLHYLFHLRYLRVSVFAQAPSTAPTWRSTLAANRLRLRTFFADVAAGRGVRVQQAEIDILAQVLDTQGRLAAAVKVEMPQRIASGGGPPLISFVAPVYNTRPDELRDLVASFVEEDAAYAELILADDGSTSPTTRSALGRVAGASGVRVVPLSNNQGIAAATNAGIALARGEWIAFIDHDDAFVTGAVAIIAKAILDHPDADFFYTDEIVTDALLTPTGAFCKPAYDSVLLSGMNYINHFSIFRRARLLALGGLRPDHDGSQDHDLLLRYLAGARAGSVVHIPFLAYAWRRSAATYSQIHRDHSVDSARRALHASYAKTHGHVEVEAAAHPDLHRIRFIDHARPLVSVVIPSRDSLAFITRIVADLQRRTDYLDIEIVVVDNGTKDAAVLRFYNGQATERFAVDLVEEPFNFSRMCNRGARRANGDLLLFLNNDIEVLTPDWLDEMVECLSFVDAGIVGAKLLYPCGRLQHAGVIVGLGQAAGHWYVNEASDEPGPMGRLAARQTFGAVTGACMLVRRSCFEAVAGFDEHAFPVAYNDVDLCLRARQVGFRTIWTPFATLTHHESAARGSDEQGDNQIRFRVESARLRERHGTTTLVDDAYSPSYDRRYSKPHLTIPETLPPPRRSGFG